jgi:meso-butanediol dehydrogenase / (S,S)-butanediol dehydrogenase / diacetyl reductase
MERFAGKVVLVTGAGSGIGAATARRFSDEGAAVVMVDRDEAKLRATAASFPAERTVTVAADVADRRQSIGLCGRRWTGSAGWTCW